MAFTNISTKLLYFRLSLLFSPITIIIIIQVDNFLLTFNTRDCVMCYHGDNNDYTHEML